MLLEAGQEVVEAQQDAGEPEDLEEEGERADAAGEGDLGRTAFSLGLRREGEFRLRW